MTREPQIRLAISRDGGKTYSNWMWVSLGAKGDYKQRAIWRCLGQSTDWVFKVRVTDDVKADLLGADIDYTVCKS